MPVDLVESPISIKSMTLSIDFHLTGQDTLPNPDTGDPTLYNFTDDAEGAVSYTRTKPQSTKRACGTATQDELLALLQPGEFLMNSACCCPCNALLFARFFARTDYQVIGARTYSNVDPTDETTPVPAAQPILFGATFSIDFAACRKNLPSNWTAAAFSATQPRVVLATGAANEIVVTVSPPGMDVYLYEGTATLEWTNADGSPGGFSIAPSILETNAPNLPSALDSLCGNSSGLIITRVPNGLKLSFLGTAPSVSVSDNSLFCAVLTPAKEHLIATFDLYFPTDDGTPMSPYFIQQLNRFNDQQCTGAFNFTDALTNEDHSLTGNITASSG